MFIHTHTTPPSPHIPTPPPALDHAENNLDTGYTTEHFHMHTLYPTMITTQNRYDTTPHDFLPSVAGKHHMQS
jgi:hypothetical protein